MKIIIFGASGSGTTTLGRALATRYEWSFLDADDYYWQKTDPPYQIKVPLKERTQALMQDFLAQQSVVVSGSLVTWGEEWQVAFELGIFLHLPPEIRIQRLQKREIERYAEQLEQDPKVAQNSKDFIAWARQYDDPNFNGRSITQHNNWIKQVSFPVLRAKGAFSLEDLLVRIDRFLVFLHCFAERSSLFAAYCIRPIEERSKIPHRILFVRDDVLKFFLASGNKAIRHAGMRT